MTYQLKAVEGFSHTTPFFNHTHITVILALFQKWITFESQKACIINVWSRAEILPNPGWELLQSLQKSCFFKQIFLLTRELLSSFVREWTNKSIKESTFSKQLPLELVDCDSNKTGPTSGVSEIINRRATWIMLQILHSSLLLPITGKNSVKFVEEKRIRSDR